MEAYYLLGKLRDGTRLFVDAPIVKVSPDCKCLPGQSIQHGNSSVLLEAAFSKGNLTIVIVNMCKCSLHLTARYLVCGMLKSVTVRFIVLGFMGLIKIKFCHHGELSWMCSHSMKWTLHRYKILLCPFHQPALLHSATHLKCHTTLLQTLFHSSTTIPCHLRQ